MAKNRLTNLELSEVSIVDSPANPGARIALTKARGGVPAAAAAVPEEEVDVEPEEDDDGDGLTQALSELKTSIQAILSDPKNKNTSGAVDELLRQFADQIKSGDTGGNVAQLPAPVRKRLADQSEQIRKVNAELAKITGEREREKFAKSASRLQLPPTFAPHLHAIAKASLPAYDALVAHIRGLNEQVAKGALFSEVGRGDGPNGGSAEDRMKAKAEEIKRANPNLSPQQAYAKACDADPALFRDVRKETRNAKRQMM